MFNSSFYSIIRDADWDKYGISYFVDEAEYDSDFDRAEAHQIASDDLFDEILKTPEGSFEEYKVIFNYLKISNSFLKKYKNELDWEYITQLYSFSNEKEILEFQDVIYWSALFKRHAPDNLSSEFIREFADKIDWINLSKNYEFTDDQIREFAEKIDWMCLTINYEFTDDQIREFADKIHWDEFSEFTEFSDDIIAEFHTKINWNIAANSNYLISPCWDILSQHVDEIDITSAIELEWKFPAQFIAENKDVINWTLLKDLDYISEEIMKFSDL